jgi:hypothetical protein
MSLRDDRTQVIDFRKEAGRMMDSWRARGCLANLPSRFSNSWQREDQQCERNL